MIIVLIYASDVLPLQTYNWDLNSDIEDIIKSLTDACEVTGNYKFVLTLCYKLRVF
jgi:hypothetical protein